MGQTGCKRANSISEKAYFNQKKKAQVQYFTKVEGFLENSCE